MTPKLPEYGTKVDFGALAAQDPDFAKVLDSNNGYVDFQNPKHVLQLTKSLLKNDFGLRIDLPDDRLCPPVPVRFHYIRWIQSLIDTTNDKYSDAHDPEREVIGIDIGVGASCIYALLGTASFPKWRFGGSEIDGKSFDYAQKNVTLNDLTSRIRLVQTTPTEPILPLDKLRIEKADFTMCNPPFYTSQADKLSMWANKFAAPSAICTGADIEMIAEGGDAGFVLRMVEQSKELGDRVQWYTSMLGKLASAAAVIKRLKELGCGNWATGTLVTGSKTRRWVIGWSWGDLRPRNDLARGISNGKELLPLPTEFLVTSSILDRSRAENARVINELMTNLNLRWNWRQSIWAGLAIANENVWSRAARRKQQREGEGMSTEETHDDIGTIEPDKSLLVVKISVNIDAMVAIRWLKGHDHIIFESFCGMVKRKLNS